MTTTITTTPHKNNRPGRVWLPAGQWLRTYGRVELTGDLLAGLIVAIMLIPQSMAYALLAGLPPQVGLYASILPLIIYGLLGSSRTLAVGPVAMVSLLVASGVTPLAEPGSADYVQLALTLAFLVAIIQTGLGLLRAGFAVNFLSHPVLSGFTSAAALVIGLSQIKHLFGISMPRSELFYEQLTAAVTHLPETKLITFGIGLSSVLILLFFKKLLGQWLEQWGVNKQLAITITKSAPLVVVILGTLLVWFGRLDETAGVAIVGVVPAGLPSLTAPTFDLTLWQQLLPTALAIGLVGYMESISVAKSLASKRREKIDPDQELFALGMANVAATFTGGYPVTGGISRSVVNFSAGARTGLASVLTAVLIALTVTFLTPIFYFLPQAVLAAIILVAVSDTFDYHTLRQVWSYSRADGLSWLITFAAVLLTGVEMGIVYGAIASIGLYIWRTSQPHIAIVGRVGQSEQYLNTLRHPVQTWPEVVAMRIDESLYFANARFLEETVLNQVAEQPAVRHFVLICTAVNFIDASALETLENLHHELKDAGVCLHFAAVKGPVMDRLKTCGFVEQIGPQYFYLSTHEAMQAIGKC